MVGIMIIATLYCTTSGDYLNMAIDKATAEYILDHGVDLKNRRIYFGNVIESYDSEGSDFTWRSVERVIRAIHVMEQDAPKKPIEIHMSSPGGDAYEMLRLVDVIEHSPCQFKFYGSGKIMSSATWIMAICDERFLYRNVRILIHDSPAGGWTDGPSKLTDRRIDQQEEDLLQERLNKLYAENSRMPENFYTALVKRDCYLSAEECVMLGLADKILEPKKRGNLRRSRIASLNKEVDKVKLTGLVRKLYKRIDESKLPAKIEVHIQEEQFDSKVSVEKDEAPEKTIEQTETIEVLNTPIIALD